jgi:hypothetical protein
MNYRNPTFNSRRIMRIFVLIALFVIALALVGCQQQAAPPAPPAPVATAPAAPGQPVAPAVTTPAPTPMVKGIGGTPDAASAKSALRSWLDCFIKGDGGIFYDMMPNATRARYDQWFAQLSSNPKWKADPDSAKVPTGRHFMIMAFEEAKKQGNMMPPVSNADFNKLANTCQMSGNTATFTNKKGEKMLFTLEPEGWKMDAKFANSMVDGIIKSVKM